MTLLLPMIYFSLLVNGVVLNPYLQKCSTLLNSVYVIRSVFFSSCQVECLVLWQSTIYIFLFWAHFLTWYCMMCACAWFPMQVKLWVLGWKNIPTINTLELSHFYIPPSNETLNLTTHVCKSKTEQKLTATNRGSRVGCYYGQFVQNENLFLVGGWVDHCFILWKCWCCMPHPACVPWLLCSDAVMKFVQTVCGSKVETTAETNSTIFKYSIVIQHSNVKHLGGYVIG